MYSLVHADISTQEKVIHSYNIDGPGFTEDVNLIPRFKENMEKTSLHIGQTAVVGRFFDHYEKEIVVHSNAVGLYQHDVFSWEVLGKSFVKEHGVTKECLHIENIVKDILKDTTALQKQQFVEVIFDMLQSTDSKTLLDVNKKKQKLITSYLTLDAKTKKLLTEMTSRLVMDRVVQKYFFANIKEMQKKEKEKAKELNKVLVEAAAENDESLMEKFFDQGMLSEDEMREGIRKGLVSRDILPVFCVSALKDMGVRRMMEFLGNVVPFVDDMPKPEDNKGEEIAADSNGPTSLFVFKTSVEPHIGEVSYFKVMSGTIKAGDDLTNMRTGNKERIAQLYCVCGQIRTNVDQLKAGDIGATVKMKDVSTGDTLNAKGCEYVFDFIKYPAPKFQRAIKPVNEPDAEKLNEALNRMHLEDPTWIVEQSKELKQTIVSGQGEFHLRTLKWRIENNEKIPVNFFEPRIPYRETITKASRADYRHKKQSGGAGQFGEVHLIIEPYTEGMPEPDTYRFGSQEYRMNVRDKQEIPLDWGGKLVVYNCIVGGAIDARFIPAIVKGLMDRMEQGPLTGSYARDVRVCIYDGKMHPVDSNEISFRLAGRNAFSEAFRNANPKILEPVYDVEVLVPSDKMGDVMSDLQGRRAIIMGMESENGFEKITARVPLKEMASYSTALSSITGGRSSFTMKFSAYELVPTDIQEKLLKAYAEENHED